MTVTFANLPTFFETKREKQEEYFQEFVRDVFPDFFPELKLLV